MIDITGVDLVKFTQKVYELSRVQGMGVLAARPGPLSEEEATAIVHDFREDEDFALSLDYLHGRSCKMHVRRQGGKLTIPDAWFDHSQDQLDRLLDTVGIKK